MAPKSWLSISPSSHFSLANIPFGIISTPPSNKSPRPAIALGDYVLDLEQFAAHGGFSKIQIDPQGGGHLDISVFSQPTLNAFAALGRPVHRQVRKYLQDIFADQSPYPEILRDNQQLRKSALLPRTGDSAAVQTHVPLQIGDYTDFCAGKNHAFNLGSFFEGPDKALHANYTHLPIGYHGRASSIVVSGTPIIRPNGQTLANPAATAKIPTFGPSQRLDIELELGAFITRDNALGQPVPISQAADSLFGLVLVNDWSARDVQGWEYIPLGPLNSKNFATTISPWVVLIDALEPFKAAGIPNDSQLLPYLQEGKSGHFNDNKNVYDIRLKIDLTAAGSKTATTISNSNAKNLIFSFPQMVAHHTIGGCPLRVGDLIASGTISGAQPGSEGSLVELSRAGTQTIQLRTQEEGEGGKTEVVVVERKFLQDGDTVTFSGVSGTEEEGLVGFGECTGTILPALKL